MTLSPIGNNELQGASGEQINRNGATDLKNEFLTLMVAQIKNQDPLNPLDGAEYVAQLAQFSTVEGIERMSNLQSKNNILMNTMQALQSTQLVGREVSVPAARIELIKGETLKGSVKLAAAAGDVRVRAVGADGKVASEVKLGARSAGEVAFELPKLPAGQYTLEAVSAHGTQLSTSTPFLQRVVEKVSIPPGGGDVRVQVSGVGNVSLFSISDFLGADS